LANDELPTCQHARFARNQTWVVQLAQSTPVNHPSFITDSNCHFGERGAEIEADANCTINRFGVAQLEFTALCDPSRDFAFRSTAT
jgi:hypothetical protein